MVVWTVALRAIIVGASMLSHGLSSSRTMFCTFIVRLFVCLFVCLFVSAVYFVNGGPPPSQLHDGSTRVSPSTYNVANCLV